MRLSRLGRFIGSARARLAGTYLLIIMILSIGFSVVLYHTSSQQLGRQIPPDSFFNNQRNTNLYNPDDHTNHAAPQIDDFLQKRIDEGRHAVLIHLIYLNLSALIVGALVSYVLARRSLQPIEAAMEAQAQFVSDASHELRTPLTAIQTSNEVFLRKPKVTVTQATQLIEQNTNDVKRLKDLSDGLLRLSQQSKQATLELKPLHIQDSMSQALNLIVAQATEKDITLHDDLHDVVVQADQTTLIQALVILLDNAVKYSDKGGNIYLASHKRGRYAYIAIRDDGMGIRASDLPHLFRRFYRADNARTSGDRSGYGLGLPIAKQIIDNHHGTIMVDSTPNVGSTFTLKLSLA